MMTALATGMFLGLSCGVAPGPLVALVVSQTLRHGAREGCKIAASPLVTDAPIIVVALGLAARLAHLRPLLGVVAIAGGVFVIFLAWDSLRPTQMDTEAPPDPPRSWFKGILTNLLSPYPWLFWLTAGATILAKAIAQSWLTAIAFLVGFYALLVGSKMVLALLAGRTSGLLAGTPYRVVMRILAALLACFALLLFREGYRLLAMT